MRLAVCFVLSACLLVAALACGPTTTEPGPDGEADAATETETELASLTTSRGDLVPPFDPARTAYNLKLPLDALDLIVTPMAASDEVDIAVNGTAVASGQGSPAFDLVIGENIIEVVVTADDGGETVYSIFPERGAATTERLLIKSPTPAELAAFGRRVTIDGDTMVVADVGETLFAVFDRTESGDWLQSAVVPRPVGVGNPSSISLSGERLALGFPGQTVGGIASAGEVHIYRLIAGVWQFRVRVTSPSPGQRDFFGRRVLIEGDDTLYVSAPDEDSAIGMPLSDDSAIDSGAVMIFERNPGVGWFFQSHLKSPDAASEDFGQELALAGDTLVVSGTIGFAAGRVHVFERDTPAGAFTHRSTLRGRGGGGANFFGDAIAIEDGTIVVGDPIENVNLPDVDTGAVYWFAKLGTEWVEQGRLGTPGESLAGFGGSVALCQGALAVADASFGPGLGSGRVLLYSLRTDTVRLLDRLEQTEQVGVDSFGNPEGDSFGSQVHCAGNDLFISAPSEDGAGADPTDNSLVSAGALYVFR